MKKIMIIISVFVFFTNNLFSKSLYSEPLVEKIEVNNSDEWVLMKSENGINVYYSSYQEAPGSLGLKIKFENTLDNDVKVNWTLRKGDIYFLKNVELNIDSKKTFQVDNTAFMIPFVEGDLLKDFIIVFHKKQ